MANKSEQIILNPGESQEVVVTATQTKSLEQIGTGLNNLSNGISDLSSQIGDTLSAVGDVITKVADNIAITNTKLNNLIEKIQDVSDERNNQLQQFEDNLNKKLQECTDQICEQLQQFEENLNDQLQQFEENLTLKLQKIVDEINTQLQQFEEALNEKIQKVSDERNKQLQQFEDHITEILEEKLQLIADMIEGDAKILFKKIANDLFSNFDFEHSSKSSTQVAQETVERAASFCKKIDESLT